MASLIVVSITSVNVASSANQILPRIWVHLYDSDGNPVVKTQVTVYNTDYSNPVTATTGANGMALLTYNYGQIIVTASTISPTCTTWDFEPNMATVPLQVGTTNCPPQP